MALVLGVAVTAELQQAQIYNQTHQTKTESGNRPASEAVGNAAHNPSEIRGQQESHWYNIFINHPTDWLLVLFNGMLALYTRRLYRATRGLFAETAGLRNTAEKQSADMQASIRAAVDLANAAITNNQIAVTTAEQRLRAYVTVQEVHVQVHRQPDRIGTYNNQLVPGNPHTYRFSVILKNGGATPAINARINISCDKFNGRIPLNFAFPSSQLFGNALIGPQVLWHTPSVTVGATELQDPAVPAERYLWGWIEYDDIFPVSIRHRTEFCFQIIFERLPPTNEGWLRFEPYSRFNAADGDCLRLIDPATGQGGG